MQDQGESLKRLGLSNSIIDNENRCLGRIYRAHENDFINARGEMVYTIRFTPMKKLSCPGCEMCDWLDDCVSYNMECQEMPTFPEPLQFGALYELMVIKENRDWETGIVEECILGFVKKEKPNAGSR